MQKRAYLDQLTASGCVPLPVPPGPPDRLRVLYDFCDGIFLPGGRDVSPSCYGESPLIPRDDEFQPELDRTEITITRWAARDQRPLLAVCRGAQVLNVALGGTLWQDLARQTGRDDHGGGDDDVTTAHDVVISDTSRLAKIFGATRVRVNSRHHQAVRVLGQGLRPTAHAEDGIIEAIEPVSDWFAVAVQWHPEDMPDPAADAGPLFAALAAAAGQRRAELGSITRQGPRAQLR